MNGTRFLWEKRIFWWNHLSHQFSWAAVSVQHRTRARRRRLCSSLTLNFEFSKFERQTWWAGKWRVVEIQFESQSNQNISNKILANKIMLRKFLVNIESSATGNVPGNIVIVLLRYSILVIVCPLCYLNCVWFSSTLKQSNVGDGYCHLFSVVSFNTTAPTCACVSVNLRQCCVALMINF